MSGDLDREIDCAVREMLDVEAPASIRARVLARIGAGVAPKPRSGEGGRRWEWIAAPIAAAALLVLAVMLKPAPSLQSVPIARVVVAPALSGSRSFRLQPEETAAHLPAKAGSHGTPPRAMWLPALAGSTASAGRSTIDIAPLTAPAPISVRAVQPRPLDHPEVAIDALPDITPISIEPLPPGRH